MSELPVAQCIPKISIVNYHPHPYPDRSDSRAGPVGSLLLVSLVCLVRLVSFIGFVSFVSFL